MFCRGLKSSTKGINFRGYVIGLIKILKPKTGVSVKGACERH